MRARWSVIPLIVVSGSLGEDLAIKSFKSGATDWVPKNDLSRLAPAVRRAMREVEERAERRHLEALIRFGYEVGQEAGFSVVREPFATPTGLIRMYSFKA